MHTDNCSANNILIVALVITSQFQTYTWSIRLDPHREFSINIQAWYWIGCCISVISGTLTKIKM
ncbi:hypothetical protein BDV37DRAFT_154355 [Aspergillus pseudonomiae]|uniref:Uncharacterized protein n=1 Tax=Aspergillus pseudonomiae TaxID=1506151 RepID=A0A5N7D8L3_9EURO|nr:uncharacterized protein BDV37DRAFT_154355 [Aspergillus pseudonomiae]KAE8402790.1 hypothetical protein BDV37DRAFT_154355 [Aspergillus pseudonomiae]